MARDRERRLEYMREHNKRPDVKAKRKAHVKRSEKVKAWKKEYMKEYNKRPDVRAKRVAYLKEYQKEYRQRPEVRARRLARDAAKKNNNKNKEQ